MANKGKRWSLPWVPVGLLGGVALVATAALLTWPIAQQAQGAPLGVKDLAGFQTTDRLLLAVSLPHEQRAGDVSLRLELLGADGKAIEQAERVVKKDEGISQHFEMKGLKVPPAQVKVRCTYGTQTVEAPLSQILLVKAHETAVSVSRELYAGSSAAVQCEVRGVRSYTETVPLPDVDIEIRLRDTAGKAHDLYRGQADRDGKAAIQVQLPRVAEGSYKLEVRTRSGLGEETLTQDVQLRTAPRILLVSDKPMYQPGQVIRLRALSLEGFDLTPAADQPITFEVEDSKGNKVFKRELKTSAHGIAAADFQLASEVSQGEYRVRALLGKEQSEKSVTVKPYVLPRFKTSLEAGKRFYLQKETIKAELQVDYFFGKPVAGGEVEVKASTFDVAFKEFATWKGKTDDRGHAKVEIKLPDYFVGQPLQKGNALVKLEVKVTDTADHSETVTRTYPVSDQPVKVSLIPEGGRLTPEMENRIFAAAIYPDGSPAVCTVELWKGREKKGRPLASVKTSAAGLAEFKLTPAREDFHPGPWGQRTIEMLGGQTQQVQTQQLVLDLFAHARDAQGSEAQAVASLNSEPLGENVLLRLDRAIYRGGETINVDIRTSAGLPTVYLDVVRGGQTVLTRWLDVRDGKAEHRLDLPASLFGTLEVHAYQMLAHGEIIRDSRVVYVHAASDLKIDVQASKDVYRPGQEGTIRFQVTDTKGNPTAAALGVIVVDEAVYALQEMQPGLEKVYFTLQEELLRPQAQVVYRPREGLDDLVREPALAADRQQVAEVLLTAVRPKVPARWEVRPEVQRRQEIQGKVQQIGWALFSYGQNNKVLIRNRESGKWELAPDLLQKAIKQVGLNESILTDPLGGKLSLASLAAMEKDFTAEHLATGITQRRLQTAYWHVAQYASQHRVTLFKDNKWTLPLDVLDRIRKAQPGIALLLEDAWGQPLRLVRSDKDAKNPLGQPQLEHYRVVSVGPDGKVGTKDDIALDQTQQWQYAHLWWLEGKNKGGAQVSLFQRGGMFQGPPGGIPLPTTAAAAEVFKAAVMEKKADPGKTEEGGGAPPRVREYFPETMLWRPELITDEQGVAVLPVTFADSITTWRLTASASSRQGLLGGTTVPLRVFQDFFVEPDLPLNLTQGDEVSFPVAVYNYLKTPQRVRLELAREPWFELVDGAGFTRQVDLKAGEVTAVRFRIRAGKIGFHPLTVKAFGTRLGDAVKRAIEVVPNGKQIDQVAQDRLGGTVSQTLTIPAHAIEDASKLFVKIYPGVMSQVLEGTEGMLRLPGG